MAREKAQAHTENNEIIRKTAHARLDQIFNDMERDGAYGTAGIEVTFEHGKATIVRRTLNGTDRRGV